MNTKLTGRWGEAQAAEFLRKKGYKIVASGYRTRLGEIDLVAEDRKTLVFVEVKTRKNDRFAKAAESVGYHKQQRLMATAEMYLISHETKKDIRFDVVEVYAPEGEKTFRPTFNHIENAFTDER